MFYLVLVALYELSLLIFLKKIKIKIKNPRRHALLLILFSNKETGRGGSST